VYGLFVLGGVECAVRRNRKQKGERKLQRKYYLPTVASLLIFAIMFSSLAPATAVVIARPKALPTLVVQTIPEDDQLRETGVIVLGLTPPTGFLPGIAGTGTDFIAQYKLLITFNGVAIAPLAIVCQFIEKDKVNPVKDKQFSEEQVRTVVRDASSDFVCKPRFAKPGVGVLDVYYVGPLDVFHIADYVLVVSATTAIGRSTIYGSDVQDVCVLGFPLSVNFVTIDLPTGAPVLSFKVWDNQLGPFDSCEAAALAELQALGQPIPAAF
jgi:hypothetical protein